MAEMGATGDVAVKELVESVRAIPGQAAQPGPGTAAPVSTTASPAAELGLSDEQWERFDLLQERIGVRFRRLELLREAMTHASWNNERGEKSGPGHDNERLEYLGDAVLELVVGEYLFKRFPGHDEGQLTQMRAALVNTISLARLAERLELGETLLLGRGAAKTGARTLPSLLANSFEAMIGAIFLDQGFRVAGRVFLQNVGDLTEWTDANYKGRLQEVAQERAGTTPSYRVVPAAGSGSRRGYQAEAMVGKTVLGHGRGATKQAAEQAAAQDALDHVDSLSREEATATRAAARAARGAALETPRVRRRVAEVAADRDVRRKRHTAPPSTAPEPRRGLLGSLRAAAEALVGRREPEPPPPPEPKKRTRRGHRGGRGRRSGQTD